MLEYRLGSRERLELPAGLDRQTMLYNLDRQRTGGAIRSFKIEGVDSESEAGIALLYALWAHAGADSRGQEIRLIMPIGRGQRRWGTAAEPLGQVILRYNAKGDATAQLVGHGTARGKLRRSAAELTRSLTGKFALRGIRGDWRREELFEVLLAFRRIPAADRGALAGAILRRVAEIDAEDHGTAAQFFYQQALDGTNVDETVELRISDLAFAHSESAFVGDAGSVAPPSIQTVLHEVGHAVETESARAARHRASLAVAAGNRVVADWNRFNRLFVETYNAILDRERPLIDERNSLAQRHNRIIERTPTILKHSRLARRLADGSRRIEVLDQRIGVLSDAGQALNRLQDALEAFVRDAGEAGRAREALAEYRARPDRDAGILEHAQRVHESRIAGGRQDLIGEPQQLAKVPSGERSQRLLSFVEYVNRHGISPGITAYARDTWPAKPGELFAEAYALWLTDPAFLEHNAPLLYGWFQRGRYRQDPPV